MSSIRRNIAQALIAQWICAICVLWMLSFLLFGGSSAGNAWYGNLASNFFNDKKAGMPMVALAIPLFICTSFVMLLLGSLALSLRTLPPSTSSLSNNPLNDIFSKLQQKFSSLIQTLTFASKGDVQINPLAFTYLLLPVLIYLTSSILRHHHKLSESANQFGMAALVTLSFILIPVSKHSMLFEVLFRGALPSTLATTLHMWAGRVSIVGALVHGSMYINEFWVATGTAFGKAWIIPPLGCWSLNNKSFKPEILSCDSHDDHDHNEVDGEGGRLLHEGEAHHNGDGCNISCYEYFRNLTGFLTLSLFLIIVLSSLPPIRRSFYKIFYSIHIVAAPLSLFGLILHYYRALLYLSPGLLYYLALKLPLLADYYHWVSRKLFDSRGGSCASVGGASIGGLGPTRIVSITELPASTVNSQSCVSLVLEIPEGTVDRYSPGQHVKLGAKEVSTVFHPFTVNVVPEYSSSPNLQHGQKEMEIIFRVCGSFTKELAQGLLLQSSGVTEDFNTSDNDTSMKTPNEASFSSIPSSCALPITEITTDGFYGTKCRVRQALSHDTVIFIAGGIGITPYLSILHELYNVIYQSCNYTDGSNVEMSLDVNLGQQQHIWPNNITLHWVCRDVALIEHIKKRYFDALVQKENTKKTVDDDFRKNTCSTRMKIIIHDTSSKHGGVTSTSSKVANGGDEEDLGDTRDSNEMSLDETTVIRSGNAHDTKVRDEISSTSTTRTISSPSTRLRMICNQPSFFTFSLIVWLGLLCIYFFYSNLPSKKSVMSRAWGIVATLILASVISLVSTRAEAYFEEQGFHQGDSSWQRVRAMFQSARYRLMGHGNFRTEIDQDDKENTAASNSVERCVSMKAIPHSPSDEEEAEQNESKTLDLNKSANSDTRTDPNKDSLNQLAAPSETIPSNNSTVTLKHLMRKERVSIHSLLDSLEDSACPGLFVCGPVSMTRDVRDNLKARCSLMKIQDCIANEGECALYEEVFTF